MKYFEGRPGQQLDLSRLLYFVRTGQIYALAIEQCSEGFEIKAEVVVPMRGLTKINCQQVGRAQFATREEAEATLSQALNAEPPRFIDWHLKLAEAEFLLCGAPLKSGKRAYPIATPEQFYADTLIFPGPRCPRCLTQAFVLGWHPNP